MTFTANELARFETFGFVVLRGFLGREELAAFAAEFDLGLARARKEMSRKGGRRQLNWSNLGPDTPRLAGLLEDPRFVGAAEQLYGGGAVGHYANSNSFDGEQTEWHPDTADLRRRGVKFAFYLQPLDGNTGALRLVPGSHRDPLHSAIAALPLKQSIDGVANEEGLPTDEVPAFAARSEPGDVIAFDNRVWHASWGGGSDRRMCSVGYFAAPETPGEEASVRELVGQHAGLVDAFPLLRPHPEWLANPGGSPQRRRWLEVLRRWGFEGHVGSGE